MRYIGQGVASAILLVAVINLSQAQAAPDALSDRPLPIPFAVVTYSPHDIQFTFSIRELALPKIVRFSVAVLMFSACDGITLAHFEEFDANRDTYTGSIPAVESTSNDDSFRVMLVRYERADGTIWFAQDILEDEIEAVGRETCETSELVSIVLGNAPVSVAYAYLMRNRDVIITDECKSQVPVSINLEGFPVSLAVELLAESSGCVAFWEGVHASIVRSTHGGVAPR